MSGKSYALFRFTHPDGSAKEWAYAGMDTDVGRYEVRWGRAGRLVQTQVDLSAATIKRREIEKLNKGYRYLGRFLIGSGGEVSPLPRAQPPLPAAQYPVDIAALLGRHDDGFYF